jgi:ribonucleotide reductase beta subunit family protein with ferritin-like domain
MIKRYSIYPLQHPDLWDRYLAAKSQHWDTDEVDLSDDNWDSLNINEQKVLKIILAFFSVSDGIVNDNLINYVIPQIKQKEAEFFYNFQTMNEDIHSVQYGLFIERYIKDSDEKLEMYTPIEHMKTVRDKANWALKWIELKKDSLAHKIVSFSIVEGLFFSSLFATVFYFRQTNKLPGLCQGNELIMKDEQAHYEFAINYYKNYIGDKIPNEELRLIILSAYEIEKEFVNEMLETGLPNLTKDLMIQYVQYVVDTILVDYGLSKEFNVSQPLEFMNRIAMSTRSNFFERKSGTYTKIKQSENLFDDDF